MQSVGSAAVRSTIEIKIFCSIRKIRHTHITRCQQFKLKRFLISIISNPQNVDKCVMLVQEANETIALFALYAFGQFEALINRKRG